MCDMAHRYVQHDPSTGLSTLHTLDMANNLLQDQGIEALFRPPPTHTTTISKVWANLQRYTRAHKRTQIHALPYAHIWQMWQIWYMHTNVRRLQVFRVCVHLRVSGWVGVPHVVYMRVCLCMCMFVYAHVSVRARALGHWKNCTHKQTQKHAHTHNQSRTNTQAGFVQQSAERTRIGGAWHSAPPCWQAALREALSFL